MGSQRVTNVFRVDVGGSELPADVSALMTGVVMEDSLHLPDVLVLTFRDPERLVIEKGGFEIGAKVEVSVVSEDATGGEALLKGEVTALEADISPTGTLTVVRAYDESHRLFRGRWTETFVNVSYDDVARQVCKRAGLQPGTIDATSTVHDHVSQRNTDDWRFLTGLAAEVGYEVAVSDGKLHFRKPKESKEGPAEGDLEDDDAVQLTAGRNLVRLRSTVSSAAEVKEVEVRGWDATRKEAVQATAPAKASSAELSVGPADLAGKFGDPTFVAVDTPYATQSEADAAAASLAEQIGGAFAELDGVARGNPKLRAGVAVSLSLLGKPFDGKYVLTSTTHRFDPELGYLTAFTVSGRQERTLVGLTSGGGAGTPSRIGGVVPAVVSNNKDDAGLGRVKVKLPWLAEKYESDWARVAQAGAGGKRGAMSLPEVNDEVLVSFEQGDIRRPYVLGSLWNGVDGIPTPADELVGTDGLVARRGIWSRTGHRLVLDEGAELVGITLATGDGKYSLQLDQQGTAIKVKSDGTVEIESKRDVTVKSDAKLSLEAKAKIEIKGQGVSIDAGQAALDMKTNAALTAKGTTVSVQGSGSAEVKSSGVMTVQGSLVRIN